MSDIITPNLNGLTERQFRKRGQMNVTHDELGEQLKAFAQAILEAFGPIGAMQVELMKRQQALEDHLKFIYVPATKAPAVSENEPGDPSHPASEATPCEATP